MVNPFDLRTALLAKHAQHVVLIHFPIALFIAGVGFDLIAQRTKNSRLEDAAYYNLMAAACATVPALATGLLAWQFQLEGQTLKGTLLLHLVMACISTALIWGSWWAHFRSRRQRLALPRWRMIAELAGVFMITLTGHLGGFLSGVNLPG